MQDARAILARWPSRSDVAADAGVDLYAVHRWHQRNRIPARHYLRLTDAAEKRGLTVTLEELAATAVMAAE